MTQLVVMSSQVIPSFKNVEKSKLFYIFCSMVFVSICVIYILSIKSKSEVPSYKSTHLLCVIVPFRDTIKELLQFVPHTSKFLNRQGIRYRITVVNQIDDYRFNRGALINAGFQLSTRKYTDCDYMAVHDIDLLPLNDEISYEHPRNVAFHVASPEYLPIHSDETFVSGILIMSKWRHCSSEFIQVDGLSNKFWDRRKEDDDLYSRLTEKSIVIERPQKLSTNRSTTFRQIPGASQKRDIRCENPMQNNDFRRDRTSGVLNVQYNVSSFHSMTIDGFPFDLYNVNLICDEKITPWCSCSKIISSTTSR